MDNQHRHIKGYRELDAAEIEAMNAVKAIGERLEGIVDELRGSRSCDQRWVSIGATDLQTGIMALVRSIAKPESF